MEKTKQCQRLPKWKFPQNRIAKSSKKKPIKADEMANKPARI